jgi:dihydrofolate reductase
MARNQSRRIIAALQISLDGYTDGPNGDKGWVDSWADAIGLVPDVDLFVLGGRMYPSYGEYWEGIYTHPERVPSFGERPPSKSEIAYARMAARTPHVVLSTTLTGVSWPTARIVRNVGELQTLKDQPGKNAYVVGGATIVASLLNENLIDELRLIVHPIILGGGRLLFGAVTERRSLELIEAKPTTSGRLIVNYRLRNSQERALTGRGHRDRGNF